MKYQCMECRAIYETHFEAERCCQPRIELVADDRVAPCQTGGENHDDPTCVFCQGTGWMLKPAEKAGTS